MKISRREFVGAGLAGAVGLCVGGCTTRANADEPHVKLRDEDGYKLWLRYTLPGKAAKSYRRIVRQIRVDGASATCGIIRDELRSATTALLSGAVSVNENGLADGTVMVGTPDSSSLIR